MSSGPPPEARWMRDVPRRSLNRGQLDSILHAALGSHPISTIHPLTDGFRNANFKIEFADGSEPVVLRLYEHDPGICQKEVDLVRLVQESVPVPEIIYAEPRPMNGLPPSVIMKFVEGISIRDLRHTGDNKALEQAGHSLGQILARIGQFSFDKSGWISAGPAVTAPLLEGSNPIPRFIDRCLGSENLKVRVPAGIRDRNHQIMWDWAPELAALDAQSQLVHGDWSHRNLLVRRVDKHWRVAAILDWEFAVAYTPLTDIGHFLLRHERRSMDIIEPEFIRGYLDGGGTLPENWRQLARLVDLIAVCESLTHAHLPEAATKELVDLVQLASLNVLQR